uniref:nicotinamidase n=1 Tax=candidate division WOR-3 bacterium TaxID=2052148 RepID=A0A7V3KPA3_UNCW3
MKIKLREKDALIVVDLQNDFCPGGALAVPEGDKIVPVLNAYIERFSNSKSIIVATRDWHPENHISFAEQGGIWPKHCVQNTKGAEFHPDLRLPSDSIIVSKATEPDKEAYSGFDGTNLDKLLKGKGVTRLFVGGLATDYCVRATVLDALRLGFCVFLLLDAIKGVNVQPEDSERAIVEMLEKGAIGIFFEEIK